MKTISITIDESELKKLVVNHLKYLLGEIHLETTDIKIEVKSTQNYKAEWEQANFRAVVHKSL